MGSFKWLLLGLLLGTVGALATGCGAPESVDQTEPDYADVADEGSGVTDVGQLEQALIVLPNGYGIMTNQNRCFVDSGRTTWPGGKCRVPFLRTVNVVERTSSCGGVYAADYAAGMLAASTYIRAVAANQGWVTYRNNPIPDRQHPAVAIELNCGSVFSGSSANSIGGTSVVEGGCTSSSAGQICQYAQTNNRLYGSRFEALPAMATWTHAQRQMAVRNVLAHEGGHGLGLGHDLCGASPLADLMGNGACQNMGAPSTFYNASLTNIENNWLRDYRPF